MPTRQLEESDLDMILAWRNSLEIRQHMFTSHVISSQEHRNWFERISSDESIKCFIHENSFNEPDGVITYSQINPEFESAHWGFYLRPQAASGSGQLLGLDGLDLAFNSLKLSILYAEVFNSNIKSIRFHERLGFVRIRKPDSAKYFSYKDNVLQYELTFENYSLSLK